MATDNQHDNGNSGSKPVIVAIGASAGGVQALQALFDKLPDRTGAAFPPMPPLPPRTAP